MGAERRYEEVVKKAKRREKGRSIVVFIRGESGM